MRECWWALIPSNRGALRSGSAVPYHGAHWRCVIWSTRNRTSTHKIGRCSLVFWYLVFLGTCPQPIKESVLYQHTFLLVSCWRGFFNSENCTGCCSEKWVFLKKVKFCTHLPVRLWRNWSCRSFTRSNSETGNHKLMSMVAISIKKYTLIMSLQKTHVQIWFTIYMQIFWCKWMKRDGETFPFSFISSQTLKWSECKYI